MLRLLRFVFALVIIPGGLAAQGLPGRVTDSADGGPLPGVSIYVPELERGAITDTNGSFVLPLPARGAVTLQFTMMGYRTRLLRIDLSARPDTVRVALDPSVTELEEVVITGDHARLPDQIPYTVHTVTADDLDEQQAPTLMMKLAAQPGIDRLSVGNGIGKPVIRGNTFNRILLYAFGTRIENQQWDDRHDLGVSSIGLDRVEVIHGPAALLYGADAAGGALVFHEKKPLPPDSSGGEARLGLGWNNLGGLAEAGYRRTTGNGDFYSMHAGGHGSGSYVQGGAPPVTSFFKTNYAANSKYVDGTFKGMAGLSRSWGTARLSYQFFNQRLGIVESEPDSVLLLEPEEEQRTWDVEAPFQEVNTHIVSGESVFLMRRSRIQANLAWQLNDRKEYEPVPGVRKGKEERVGLHLNVFTGEVKWTSDGAGPSGFTLGAQGMTQRNGNTGSEFLVPDADVAGIGVFALWRYDRKRVNVLAGMRYDYRRVDLRDPGVRPDSLPVDGARSYQPVSASAGAAWHPAGGLTVKVNAATGFSAPNYAELGSYGRHEGTYRFEIGDPDLKVQQNVEGDAGIIVENRYLKVEASAFLNAIGECIYLRPTADSVGDLRVYRFSQDDAVIYGGEAAVDLRFPRCAWLDVRASFAAQRGVFDGGGDMPYIAADKVSGSVKVRPAVRLGLREPFFIVTVSRWFSQNRVADFESPTGGYTLFDVQAGGRLRLFSKQARLAAYATNITDAFYYSHLSLVKSIGIGEMGRNTGFSLTVVF